jgi:hypothetical protein
MPTGNKREQCNACYDKPTFLYSQCTCVLISNFVSAEQHLYFLWTAVLPGSWRIIIIIIIIIIISDMGTINSSERINATLYSLGTLSQEHMYKYPA